jgi:hypothetical protein
VKATNVTTSFWSELVVTTIEELEPIRGGTKTSIISCTLFLPIETMEIPIVVVSIHVEGLEEPITPKPIPLVIPKIGVGVKVTLIEIVTHAFEVFRTPNTILKDTFVAKKLGFEHVPLVEPVDTIGE